MYPGVPAQSVRCDPRTLYAAHDTPLPTPTTMPLAAGTMLLFDPETLHGTHLNVMTRTRVAVSLRLNAREPRFDPECFYAREFGLSGRATSEAGADTVLHLRRDDHLAPAPPRATTAPSGRCIPETLPVTPRDDGTVPLDAARVAGVGDRVVLDAAGRRVAVVRTAGGVVAFDEPARTTGSTSAAAASPASRSRVPAARCRSTYAPAGRTRRRSR